MRDDFRLAVIGGGKMGEALVAGLLASELLEPSQITVAEIDAKRREGLTARFGVGTHADAGEAVAAADAVLLAVKPQQIDEVVRELAAALGEDTLVISIAAGVSTARLEAVLARPVPVVRVMPNQAAMAGMAVSAVSGGAFATAEHVGLAAELMGAVGKTVIIEESLQNAATALSGSGPAYVYLFAESLIEAGVRHGLTKAEATQLVVETIRGAGEMLRRGGRPADLIDAVASPGGTTVAALEEFEKAGFRAALSAAVDAAVRRAEELG